MLSGKEKREIGLIVGSVLVVLVVGLFLVEVEGNIAGQAYLNPEVPTDTGAIVVLKDFCSPVLGVGSCNEICSDKICVPIERDCSVAFESNQCLCCTSP